MQDFFPKSVLRPNPECSNNFCKRHQQIFASKPKVVKQAPKKEEQKVVHEGLFLKMETTKNEIITKMNTK